MLHSGLVKATGRQASVQSRLCLAGIIGVILCYSLAAGCAHSRIASKEARTTSVLHSIRAAVIVFENANGKLPLSPEELHLPKDHLTDPMSGKPFVWAQRQVALANSTTVYPLVWQEQPYRTSLWPFGECKQLALLSDGSLTAYLNKLKEQGAPSARGATVPSER